jgi:hypothetical protein
VAEWSKAPNIFAGMGEKDFTEGEAFLLSRESRVKDRIALNVW